MLAVGRPDAAPSVAEVDAIGERFRPRRAHAASTSTVPEGLTRGSERSEMSKLRVHAFSLSLDGFGAGVGQDIDARALRGDRADRDRRGGACDNRAHAGGRGVGNAA
jgi:hypothetical protein